MPVEHRVGRRICAVPDRVAGRQELSLLAQVDTDVREGLVAGASVRDRPANNVLGKTLADRAGEGLDLTDGVRLLIEVFPAIRTEEVKGATLIEVGLEDELVRSLLKLVRGIASLLIRWLHRRDGTSLLLAVEGHLVSIVTLELVLLG